MSYTRRRCLFVRSSLPLSILSAVSVPRCFELIILKINSSHDWSFNHAGVYRSPSAVTGAIAADLLAQFEHSELLILGDLNQNWSSNDSSSLKQLCANFNLLQLIEEQTTVDQI